MMLLIDEICGSGVVVLMCSEHVEKGGSVKEKLSYLCPSKPPTTIGNNVFKGDGFDGAPNDCIMVGGVTFEASTKNLALDLNSFPHLQGYLS